MSSQGRPKGEHRSAQHAGCLVSTAARAVAAKPSLSRERILSGTLALIDRDGVAALSLRGLARSLGVFPTAIYWHVPNRNELIGGAVALALRQVGAEPPGGPWQSRLRALFRRFRKAVRRHPHLAPVIGHELVSNGALDLPMLEQIVGALEDAGFDAEALVEAYNVVVAALCGFVTLELAALPADEPRAWAQAHRARLAQIPRADHPALARHLDRLRDRAFILRWSPGTTKPMTASFEAWIDVVITGLEARAARTAAQRAELGK